MYETGVGSRKSEPRSGAVQRCTGSLRFGVPTRPEGPFPGTGPLGSRACEPSRPSPSRRRPSPLAPSTPLTGWASLTPLTPLTGWALDAAAAGPPAGAGRLGEGGRAREAGPRAGAGRLGESGPPGAVGARDRESSEDPATGRTR